LQLLYENNQANIWQGGDGDRRTPPKKKEEKGSRKKENLLCTTNVITVKSMLTI